ncbi:hypothetical protein IAQ61_002116 [Plenodomus lingam]|uniref:uncharacterized protein n=1 Tax=Leptosphaeria maculans TaxID=5022 RepID=UPI0033284B56|nr:hypothetical protein IAQ61_002116 [Plenodomus lingam]
MTFQKLIPTLIFARSKSLNRHGKYIGLPTPLRLAADPEATPRQSSVVSLHHLRRQTASQSYACRRAFMLLQGAQPQM